MVDVTYDGEKIDIYQDGQLLGGGELGKAETEVPGQGLRLDTSYTECGCGPAPPYGLGESPSTRARSLPSRSAPIGARAPACTKSPSARRRRVDPTQRRSWKTHRFFTTGSVKSPPTRQIESPSTHPGTATTARSTSAPMPESAHYREMKTWRSTGTARSSSRAAISCPPGQSRERWSFGFTIRLPNQSRWRGTATSKAATDSP